MSSKRDDLDHRLRDLLRSHELSETERREAAI
jgi:hypothetical protein